MRRAPLLSCALWSTVTAVSLVGGGCGEDEQVFVDAANIDAQAIDATEADASLAVAAFPASVTTSAACGVAVPSTTDVTVMNTGTQDLVIASATADGGFTITTATPVTITPGSSAALTVRPPASVIGTDVGGSTKTGTLSFVTNETGAPTRTVALNVTVDGANLALVNGAGAPLTSVMFTSNSTCPSSQEISIRNTGTSGATIQLPSASGFGFGGFSPSSSVGPGETIISYVNVFTTSPCNGTATVMYQASGTICTTLPLTLSASFAIAGQSSCFCS